MASLNDLVHSWGLANGYVSYDEAKRALTDGLTQDQVADSVVPSNWNEGLYGLADIPAVLREATLWLDAQYSEAGEQVAVNQGTGRSALDATYGSTAGADTNDPLFLPHDGENYVYVPNAHGNHINQYAGTVGSLDITGDFDMRVEIALDSWTDATSRTIFSRESGDPNRWGRFYVQNGNLAFRWFPTGLSASSIIATSTAPVSWLPFTRKHVRVTMDVDNGAGGYDVKFYTSDDGLDWTQLGATVTGGAPTSLASVPGIALAIASGIAVGSPTYACQFYSCRLYDGIDGVIAYGTDVAVGTWTQTNNAVFGRDVSITGLITRATSGRKTALVTRPIWLFGTDDYMEIADNALLDFGAGESATILAVIRSFGTNENMILSKKSTRNDTNAGYWMQLLAGGLIPRAAYSDGVGVATNTPGNSTVTFGGLNGHALIRDADTGFVYWNSNGVDAAQVADVAPASWANALPLVVGKVTSSAASDMEIVAVAVWRRVLDADEIAAINTYYGTA